MRYLLAAILFCALGLPPAPAFSAAATKSNSASKREASVQTGHRKPLRAAHHGRDLGGIHPLVGSGDY